MTFKVNMHSTLSDVTAYISAKQDAVSVNCEELAKLEIVIDSEHAEKLRKLHADVDTRTYDEFLESKENLASDLKQYGRYRESIVIEF